MSGLSHWLQTRSRWALAAGALGTAGLALSSTAALGGFTASITNTGSNASTGSLVLSENVGNGTTVCLSSGTGATASNTVSATNANTTCPGNKFGLSNATPGASNSTTVVLQNVGSIPSSAMTMGVGAACAASSASNTTYNGSDTSGFCGKIDITVEDDTTSGSPTCLYPLQTGACPALSNTYNLNTFYTNYATAKTMFPSGTTSLAAGSSRTFKFTVGVDSTATNADQGLNAYEPISFNLAQ